MTRTKSNIILLVIIIHLQLFIPVIASAASEKDILDNLTQGFVKYQASRIEGILLESAIDKIRWHYILQVMFPNTSKSLNDYDGVGAKRVIPILTHYVRRDIENFDRFNHCIVKQLAKGTNSYSSIYTEIKDHFKEAENYGGDAYDRAIDVYIRKQCYNIDSKYFEKDLNKFYNRLRSTTIIDNNFLTGLLQSWVNQVMKDKELLDKLIKAYETEPDKFSGEFKAFYENVLKQEKAQYSKWLKETIKKECFDNYQSLKKLVGLNQRIYQVIHKYSADYKADFNKGANVLTHLLEDATQSLISPYEACNLSNSKSRSCQIVNLVNRLHELRSDSVVAKEKLSYSIRIHALFVTAKVLDIHTIYGTEISVFQSYAMFLADLLDAANSAKGENAANAVASAIDAFIDEDRVYNNKRKSKQGKVFSRNTWFISSYFGLNGVFDQDGFDPESKARFFGPVGLEFKVFGTNYGALGINYAPIDLGNAISNELQGVSTDNQLQTIEAKSLFLSFTLKKAPVSILLGRQWDIENDLGEKGKIDFIGVAFDLPLVTIF